MISLAPEHHRCEVVTDLNLTGMHTARCLGCGWMGGDSTKADAEDEARRHEEHPEQAKLEPWHPGKHPTPNR